MTKLLQIPAQAALYILFAAVLGYFSMAPAYTHLDPDKALIKLSFSHAGSHKGECRRLTPEEIAQLAPNMRRPLDCPRERMPLLIELVVDGRMLYRDYLQPSGLARDGAASVYQRFPVAAGRHRLEARLRDTNREEGFDYTVKKQVQLQPLQNFVIDFDADAGGFLFN